MATWRKWGAVALFVAWLFFCIGFYYVAQKPFNMESVGHLAEESESWMRLDFSPGALARTLLDMGTALWLVFIAVGLGARLLDLSSLPLSGLERVLFGLGVGFGLLGIGTLFIGLIGLLQPAVFYAITLLLTIVAAPKSIPLIRRFRFRPSSRAIGVYLALATTLVLVLALLPPTSWDALFYHLNGPKLYLEAGRIQPGTDIPHLNFPALSEMLFTMAMALRGDVAAKLIHLVYLFMSAGLVYGMAREHLNLKNGWTAVLFLYATPMVPALAAWAYNDLALSFYQVAAIYSLLSWRRHRREAWLILSGVMCGLAMGLKYTSFVAPLLLAGILVWEYRHRLAEAARPLLILALSTSVVAAPWYLKNLLFTGNPIYPFLFGGRFWDNFRSAAYAGPGTGIGLDVAALIRLPLDLTSGVRDASQDGPTGPFFLAFLPLLLIYGLARRRQTTPGSFRLLLLFALAQYLFWTIGVIFSEGLLQSRLLLPAFVALCPALAWILDELGRFDHPQFSLRRFLYLAIGFALALGLFSQTITSLPRAPLAYLLGSDSRADYLRRALGTHYVVMEEMGRQSSEDAVVALLWEPRSYYCQADCRPDSILDTFSHLEYLYGDASGIAEAWHTQGITHVLLNQVGLEFVIENGTEWTRPRELDNLHELQERYLAPVAEWEDAKQKVAYTLYRLKP